jgi:hypothetical protein
MDSGDYHSAVRERENPSHLEPSQLPIHILVILLTALASLENNFNNNNNDDDDDDDNNNNNNNKVVGHTIPS